MSGIWVKCKGHEPLPAGAVKVGIDIGGYALYAGRVSHKNKMLPAKISPALEKAYVCSKGSEHAKDDYEVLCHADVTWENCDFDNIPRNAVLIGSSKHGQKLYMGRAKYNATITPGKIKPSDKKLCIPYDGNAISIDECEIMIYNF